LPGDIIFSNGDPPTDIFLIRRGKAVLLRSDGTEAVIDAGSSTPIPAFGMLESLSGGKFSMTLRSLTKGEIQVVDAGEFLEKVRHDPELSFKLAEVLASMYEQTLGVLKGH